MMPLDVSHDQIANPDCEHAQPLLVHRQLFFSTLLRINNVVARPTSDRPSDERELTDHSIVLPYRGVFATHAGRRQVVLASTSHTVLLSARTPYRYSYPGAVGDQCLVLMWSDEELDRVAPASLGRRHFVRPGSVVAPVLPPSALLARERLRRYLADSAADPLAVEEEAMGLLLSVRHVVQHDQVERTPNSGPAAARNHSRIERIKELIASAPDRRWTLDGLAAAAFVSPYHLAHLFKSRVGLSVYEYVVRARLAKALEQVVDSGTDLTTIAIVAGFSSHSHFTAQFRARFGITPLGLRRQLARQWGVKVRRIPTAMQSAVS